eukprot:m.33925 g.33925  ORF g.33925 m.33925 type:complete len:290 (+) comp10562_c1_seq1:67-936(+)
MAARLLFEGKTAVVTGAAAGIGRAIALRFAQEGARVVVADRDADSGLKVAEEILDAGGKGQYEFMDVEDRDTIRECMSSAAAAGGLHVLVNNAVRFVFGHLGRVGSGSGTGTDRAISDDDWDNVFRTNVRGYAHCIEEALPFMMENPVAGPVYELDQGRGPSTINAGSRGAIVNIASISALIAQPEFVPYNASKGAILQLTRCCAMDLAPNKVRVNALCPGTIETPGSYAHMDLVGISVQEGRTVFGDSCLLKRQAAPDEIANGAAFLASDQASFMTGATLTMDGGGSI